MSGTLTPEQLYTQAMALLNIAQATMNRTTQKEAFELLSQSVAENYIPAMLELGRCYEKGIGTSRDADKALDIYRKAAGLGSYDGAFKYAYAQYYEKDNHKEAHTYLLKALEEDKDGKAHYLLGLVNYHGRGVEQDYQKSYALHKESALRGNTDAMFELYVYYSQGIGCTANQQTAFECNKKAADMGHYRACFNMGWFYETGTNVEQDMQKAFDYYSTASENGNGKATAYIGVMYEKGMVKPAETLDDNQNWNEDKAREIAYTYYRKAEREQDFYMLYDYLDSLGIYYEED